MNFSKRIFFSVLMGLALVVTSCSDSDSNSNSSKKYDKETNNLVYTGESAITAMTPGFTIETIDGKTSLIATNAIVGTPNLKIDNVVLTTTGGKTTFTATDNTNDRNVTFSGTITDGKLTVNGDLVFKNSILGSWKMPIESLDWMDGKMGLVDWSADVKPNLTGETLETAENSKGMLEFFGNMIGGLIGEDIDQLSINLKTNGVVGVNYRTIVDNVSHEGLPLDLALNFFIRDGKLYIAMPADLLKAIPQEYLTNDVVKTVLSLIKQEGGYAYIELKTMQGEIHKDEVGAYTLFYVDDSVFSVLTPVLVKYIQDNIDTLPIPDGIEFMGVVLTKEQAKGVILTIISGFSDLENFKFGLGFQK